LLSPPDNVVSFLSYLIYYKEFIKAFQ